jgi:hypothetical protein
MSRRRSTITPHRGAYHAVGWERPISKIRHADPVPASRKAAAAGLPVKPQSRRDRIRDIEFALPYTTVGRLLGNLSSGLVDEKIALAADERALLAEHLTLVAAELRARDEVVP